MADANTTRYGFVKPEVGASADTWGAKLNTDFDDIDAIAGAITTTGSANAYVLTTGLSLAAYVAGQTFWIKASFSNTGAATINVDTLGAKDLRKNGTTALASGDIVSGNIYAISYDGTLFQVIGPVTTQHQPLDATLSAVAALSWSSGSPVVQFTAADTVSLTLSPSLTNVTASGVINAGSGAVDAVAVGVGATTQGLYSTGTNLAFSVGSTLRGFVDATKWQFSLPVWGPSGSAGSPGLAFSADSNTGFYSIGADNMGLTLGGTKRIDYSTTLISYSVPVQSRVALSSETTGTLTSASANKKVACSGGITLDDGVFTTDDFIIFDPGTSNRTFTRASGLTMYVNGTDSASATLAANQMGAAHWRSSTVVVLTGAFT